MSSTKPPRNAGKAAAMAIGAIVFIMVVAFVGMNSYHAKDLQNQHSGQMKSEDKPQSDKDLGKLPTPQRN